MHFNGPKCSGENGEELYIYKYIRPCFAFWDRCTTHLRAYCSGWIESEVPWILTDLGFDPWVHTDTHAVSFLVANAPRFASRTVGVCKLRGGFIYLKLDETIGAVFFLSQVVFSDIEKDTALNQLRDGC